MSLRRADSLAEFCLQMAATSMAQVNGCWRHRVLPSSNFSAPKNNIRRRRRDAQFDRQRGDFAPVLEGRRIGDPKLGSNLPHRKALCQTAEHGLLGRLQVLTQG